QRAVTTINVITCRCLMGLQEIGAPPEAGRIVIEARARAVQAVRRADAIGSHAVAQALRDALSDEEDEPSTE
ncbi:MAG: hypothetical protein VYC34_09035, partial [Planctomycetota bacterium]|nr:hypothetical protein [Planctomycetota bacterium]